MAIRSFSFDNADPAAFARAFTAALQGRELGRILSLTATPQSLVIKMSKLGTSELTYAVTQAADGRRTATLNHEKIALAHRAFRSEIERKLGKVLASCGASLVTD